MSHMVFRIQEHTLPCSYIREYPLATADSQEDTLHLAIKQYTPLDNLSPKKGDVTIIAAHANGFPKVAEPFRRLMRSLLTFHSGALRTHVG